MSFTRGIFWMMSALISDAATDANKVHVIRLMEKLGLGSFKPDAN